MKNVYWTDLATKSQIKFVYLNFFLSFVNIETFKRKNLWATMQGLREHLLLGFFTLVVLCIYKKKEYDVSDDSYLFLKLFILVVSFLM